MPAAVEFFRLGNLDFLGMALIAGSLDIGSGMHGVFPVVQLVPAVFLFPFGGRVLPGGGVGGPVKAGGPILPLVAAGAAECFRRVRGGAGDE